MIIRFRKVRQKLLSEYKFSKYFLYAIGEIILVVIGIFIALQINYSNRQALKLETKYLTEIKNKLTFDLKAIQFKNAIVTNTFLREKILSWYKSLLGKSPLDNLSSKPYSRSFALINKM